MSKNRTEGRRVLIIVENLPVPQDKRVWQEAQSLTAAGCEVAVICPKGHGSTAGYEVLDGISIYRHPLPFEGRSGPGFILEYSWAFAWQVLFSWRVWLRFRFNAIHACNPPDNIFLVALPFRLFFGVHFLFDQHDGNPELWLAKGGSEGGLIHRVLRFFEKRTFRAADVSLAVNDYFIGVAKGRGGMSPGDVFLVRNAPSRHLVERTLELLSQVSDQESAGSLVGYLGVIGVQDGVDNLMHVIHEIVVLRERTDVRFRIMGDGPELKSIRALAAQLGIEDHVEFTGWVSGEDYIQGLAGCDLCVNADPANGYNELCSPNKVYEYMLFAKAIVQFDMPESRIVAGDCASYAHDNDNGELATRILELVDDPERSRAMGLQARKRFLDHFTWERSEEQLLRAYDRLYSDSEGGAGEVRP